MILNITQDRQYYFANPSFVFPVLARCMGSDRECVKPTIKRIGFKVRLLVLFIVSTFLLSVV